MTSLLTMEAMKMVWGFSAATAVVSSAACGESGKAMRALAAMNITIRVPSIAEAMRAACSAGISAVHGKFSLGCRRRMRTPRRLLPSKAKTLRGGSDAALSAGRAQNVKAAATM